MSADSGDLNLDEADVFREFRATGVQAPTEMQPSLAQSVKDQHFNYIMRTEPTGLRTQLRIEPGTEAEIESKIPKERQEPQSLRKTNAGSGDTTSKQSPLKTPSPSRPAPLSIKSAMADASAFADTLAGTIVGAGKKLVRSMTPLAEKLSGLSSPHPSPSPSPNPSAPSGWRKTSLHIDPRPGSPAPHSPVPESPYKPSPLPSPVRSSLQFSFGQRTSVDGRSSIGGSTDKVDRFGGEYKRWQEERKSQELPAQQLARAPILERTRSRLGMSAPRSGFLKTATRRPVRAEFSGYALLEHLRKLSADGILLPEKDFLAYLSKLKELCSEASPLLAPSQLTASQLAASKTQIKALSPATSMSEQRSIISLQVQDSEELIKNLLFKKDQDESEQCAFHPVFTKAEILRQYLTKIYGLNSDKPLKNFRILEEAITIMLKLVGNQLYQQEKSITGTRKNDLKRADLLRNILAELQAAFASKDIIYGFLDQCSTVLPKLLSDYITAFEELISYFKKEVLEFEEKRRVEIQKYLQKNVRKELSTFKEQTIPDFSLYKKIENYGKLREQYIGKDQGGTTQVVYLNPIILFQNREKVPECETLPKFNAEIFILNKKEELVRLVKDSAACLEGFLPNVPSLFFINKSDALSEPKIRMLHPNPRDPKLPILWIPSAELKLDQVFLELEAKAIGIIQGYYEFRVTHLDILFFFKKEKEIKKIFHYSCELDFNYKDDPYVSLLEVWFSGKFAGRYAKPTDVATVRYFPRIESIQTAPPAAPHTIPKSGRATSSLPDAAEFPVYEPFKERLPPNKPYDPLMSCYFQFAKSVPIDDFETIKSDANQKLRKYLKKEWNRFCKSMASKIEAPGVLFQKCKTLDALICVIESILCLQYGSEIYNNECFKFFQVLNAFKNRKSDLDLMSRHEEASAFLEGIEKMSSDLRQVIAAFSSTSPKPEATCPYLSATFEHLEFSIGAIEELLPDGSQVLDVVTEESDVDSVNIDTSKRLIQVEAELQTLKQQQAEQILLMKEMQKVQAGQVRLLTELRTLIFERGAGQRSESVPGSSQRSEQEKQGADSPVVTQSAVGDLEADEHAAVENPEAYQTEAGDGCELP